MLNAALEADRTRISDIEAQILHLERAISALRAEEKIVQKRLDSYKYPVLTLPNEIVSEIFTHFLPIYPGFPPLAGTGSPTSLTQICRKWREITLATPSLWKAIIFDDGLPWKRQGQIFDSWANRSGSCPLSIRFRSRDHYRELLQGLVPHLARLEYLEIHVLSDLTLHGPLPHLRHLDLVIKTDQIVVFHDAPLLRTASLTSVIGSPNISLPWIQLTRLTLIISNFNQCIAILRQTSNLVHCDLQLAGMFDRRHSAPPGAEVTLLHLESLVLDRYSGTTVIGLGYAPFFNLPALRTLHMPEPIFGATSTAMLSSLLSKWGCALQELRVTGERRTVFDSVFRAAFPGIPEIHFDTPYSKETTVDEEDEGYSEDERDFEERNADDTSGVESESVSE
ncbi:F-box domain-containing protein [Mycena venus]|uniref:F-box domain-containing protein n=1 Tax=Mycena venus TaxID=2733690 RepID=A0A8H6XPB6_9AGAR|nr:F-box domain-containing protein [Mycena venus]